jgi:hypothetical protein
VTLQEQSVIQIIPEAKQRKLKKVPFVELADGRLQGVVSSGSDINRVYVSFITRTTFNYYCSTNNNRQCGGINYGCKHLEALITEAVLQYGAERIVEYLDIPHEEDSSINAHFIRNFIRNNGKILRKPAGTVFSRFLNHLRYLELDISTAPNSDMDWFVGARETE